MDDNIINIIMTFANIKCHSCYNEINSIIKLKKVMKMYKFYYCDERCFKFY